MSENLNTSQKDPQPDGRVTDLQSLYRELQQRRIYFKLQREAAAWSRERAARPELALQTLDQIPATPCDWLWAPYLPGGMLTMLSGDPGSGTSYLALAMAAAVTRNGPVLYMSAENDPERVVRRRFDGLAGDPRQFHLLRARFPGSGPAPRFGPIPLSNLILLEEAMTRTRPRLLIIDPLQSHLDSAGGSRLLATLCRLSGQYRCATLLVRHLSKSRSGRAAARGLGALDLTGTVRSELLAGQSPDDPGQRAMIHVKSNVGPLGPALGFAIDHAGVFHWTGDSLLAVQSLLAPEPRPEEKGALGEAMSFLRAALENGARPARELQANARQAGIAVITLKRAKFLLRVESVKTDTTGPWYWQLPGQITENMDIPTAVALPTAGEADQETFQ